MTGITTQSKLKIARILSRLMVGARELCGRDQYVITRRNNIQWQLDLNEGIDLYIFLFGQFEAEVQTAYRQLIKPGSIIFDIGANIGAHTLPMAKTVGANGHVHAFEATEYAIRKLKTNLNLNPMLAKCVTVHHSLLTSGEPDEAAVDAIPSSWDLRADSHKTHPQHGGSFKSVGEASLTTLDQFTLEKDLKQIDLIKLDVDGNEWSILKGAAQTIRRFSPPILMELAPDYAMDDFKQLLHFFKARKYEVHLLNRRKILVPDLELIRSHIPKNGSINVLLIPVSGNPDGSSA